MARAQSAPELPQFFRAAKTRCPNAVFAGWWSLNGNGEMTGTTWVEESGFLEGPVMITNTHSVGVVRDAVIQWRVNHGEPDPTGYWWSLPVVAETWDGWLNDINGFHVKPEDAFHAIDSAHGGPVEEGNVGGGTGMICNEFKGGIGTSSRRFEIKGASYTVGVLVQCNYGRRPESTHRWRACWVRKFRKIPPTPPLLSAKPSAAPSSSSSPPMRRSSASPTQAPRAPRFSRPRPRWQHLRQWLRRHLHCFLDGQSRRRRLPITSVSLQMLPNDLLDPVFTATVQATEEAVINAMIAAETMTGIENHKVIALPHDKLRAVLKKYNRLVE